jgi:hypothetical protein
MKSLPEIIHANRMKQLPRLSMLHAWRCVSEACRDGLLVDRRCLALRREVVGSVPPPEVPAQPRAYS